MSELEINGHKYRTGRLNTFDQFHVMRRLVPLMSGLGQMVSNLPPPQPNGAATEEPAEIADTDFFKSLEPVADILSKMTDSDCEYVLKKCLSVCRVHNGQAFVAVMQSGQIMFEDRVDLATMMQLTMAVIQENLQSFFPVAQAQDSTADPSSR